MTGGSEITVDYTKSVYEVLLDAVKYLHGQSVVLEDRRVTLYASALRVLAKDMGSVDDKALCSFLTELFGYHKPISNVGVDLEHSQSEILTGETRKYCAAHHGLSHGNTVGAWWYEAEGERFSFTSATKSDDLFSSQSK